MIDQRREKGEVKGRFQLKACEEEIRTERIKEQVSCESMRVRGRGRIKGGLLGAFCCLTMQGHG